MDKIYNTITKTLRKGIEISLQFLCIGVIIQLLIDDQILGWDPISNIKDAGSSFIGVIAFVVLYLLFKDKKS